MADRGRPESTKDYPKYLLRLRPDLAPRVEHCQWLLQRQHGPKVTQTEAFWHIIEAGCAVLEGTLEGSETSAPVEAPNPKLSDIAHVSISELSYIAGDDISVPGYGFPEDEDETPAPQLNGAAQHALVSPEIRILEAEPQPVADPEQGASPMPAPQPEAPEPTVQTVELSEDIVKIAEVRAHHFRMSERTFAQYLFDDDIYRHRTKDGREVPIPHTTLRQWLQRAREAGLL